MCRSIVRLRDRDEMASDEAVRAAALQFVRKISGYRAPSARNQPAFDAAVDEISEAAHRLLESITSSHQHDDRHEHARAAQAS